MSEVQKITQVSSKWQTRFDFFNTYGAPNSPEFKPALQALPALQRIKIVVNFFAFFFGPIYLFILGLWKANLTLLGIILGVTAIEILVEVMLGVAVPPFVTSGINFACAFMYGSVTNYLYYRLKVKGEQSWNPFVGVRWI